MITHRSITEEKAQALAIFTSHCLPFIRSYDFTFDTPSGVICLPRKEPQP